MGERPEAREVLMSKFSYVWKGARLTGSHHTFARIGGLLIAVLLMSSFAVVADWSVEVADTTGNLGNYSSLALDGSGRPHIAHFGYYDILKHM
jgi:hypothetical protein